MPISVQVTKGLLTPAGEREVFAQISEALLKAHGLVGNRSMTPNVIGHLVVSERSTSYVGGKPQSLAIVEVKVPSITSPTDEVKQTFVSTVTHRRERANLLRPVPTVLRKWRLPGIPTLSKRPAQT